MVKINWKLRAAVPVCTLEPLLDQDALQRWHCIASRWWVCILIHNRASSHQHSCGFIHCGKSVMATATTNHKLIIAIFICCESRAQTSGWKEAWQRLRCWMASYRKAFALQQAYVSPFGCYFKTKTQNCLRLKVRSDWATSAVSVGKESNVYQVLVHL